MSKAQLYNLPPDRPQHHHPNGISRHQDVDHRQAQLQPPEPWEIAVSSTPKAGDPNETLYPPRAAGAAVKVPVIPISLEAPADRLPLKAGPGCAFPGHPPTLPPTSFIPTSLFPYQSHAGSTSPTKHFLQCTASYQDDPTRPPRSAGPRPTPSSSSRPDQKPPPPCPSAAVLETRASQTPLTAVSPPPPHPPTIPILTPPPPIRPQHLPPPPRRHHRPRRHHHRSRRHLRPRRRPPPHVPPSQRRPRRRRRPPTPRHRQQHVLRLPHLPRLSRQPTSALLPPRRRPLSKQGGSTRPRPRPREIRRRQLALGRVGVAYASACEVGRAGEEQEAELSGEADAPVGEGRRWAEGEDGDGAVGGEEEGEGEGGEEGFFCAGSCFRCEWDCKGGWCSWGVSMAWRMDWGFILSFVGVGALGWVGSRRHECERSPLYGLGKRSLGHDDYDGRLVLYSVSFCQARHMGCFLGGGGGDRPLAALLDGRCRREGPGKGRAVYARCNT